MLACPAGSSTFTDPFRQKQKHSRAWVSWHTGNVGWGVSPPPSRAPSPHCIKVYLPYQVWGLRTLGLSQKPKPNIPSQECKNHPHKHTLSHRQEHMSSSSSFRLSLNFSLVWILSISSLRKGFFGFQRDEKIHFLCIFYFTERNTEGKDHIKSEIRLVDWPRSQGSGGTKQVHRPGTVYSVVKATVCTRDLTGS